MSNKFAFIERRTEPRAPILPPLSKPPTFPYAREIVKHEGMKPAPDRHREPSVDYEQMKMAQLKLIAKDRGIKYRVGWGKKQLINAINGAQDTPAEPDSETFMVE